MTTRICFRPARAPDGAPFTQIQFDTGDDRTSNVVPPVLSLARSHAAVQAFERGQAGSDVVLSVGQALWAELARHEGCKAAFQAILDGPKDARSVRLEFSEVMPEAKHLPWEALVSDAAGFLCIDSNVAILREVNSPRPLSPGTLAANEPLRLLVVIGAQGNDGRGEWDALLGAIKGCPAGLPLETLLLASERALVDEARALARPGLRAEVIPGTADDLTDLIEDFAPHVAHFFAHGFAGPPASLAIETGNAHIGDEPILLSAADLDEALSARAWVVVLNACSLAAVAPDAADAPSGTASLCEDLVQAGIPIVVGMRGRVMAGHAHRFARGFHRRALDVLADLRDLKQGSLDLGGCFTRACRAVLDDEPDIPGVIARRLNAWALPVMTVHRTPLQVDVVGTLNGGGTAAPSIQREEILGELETLRALLRDMGDAMPQPVRDKVQARILVLVMMLTG